METAIAAVHDDLVCAANADRVTALILLDLSSAFDTVDHQIMLTVLQQRFGIDDQALKWFRSFGRPLAGRRRKGQLLRDVAGRLQCTTGLSPRSAQVHQLH